MSGRLTGIVVLGVLVVGAYALSGKSEAPKSPSAGQSTEVRSEPAKKPEEQMNLADYYKCVADHAQMEQTELKLFCEMMATKSSRDQIIEKAAEGLAAHVKH